MRWLVCALLVLAGCDDLKNVPCDQCAKYGAVCNPTTKMCQRGLVLDMAVAVETDMTHAGAKDLATQDGPTPPMCTPATDKTDCADPAKPICGTSGTCRACTGSGDDTVCLSRSTSTPHCAASGPSMGQCVQCTTATQGVDCPAATPVCGADGACRKCAAHTECPSLGTWTGGTAIPGICVLEDFTAGATTFSAGTCAPANQVAYVDNNNLAINPGCKNNSAVHDGSAPNKAYCDVQDAVAGTKPFIAVNGHGNTAYGGGSTGGSNVNITRAVTIVGPAGNATTKAQISSGTSATPSISAGMAVNVVIDGFEIGPSTSGIGLACTGVGTVLAARRNLLDGSGGGGVSASNCTVSLVGNTIQNNAGGGVSATMSTITLDGNVIVSNSAGGVTLTTSKYTLTNNIIGLNGTLGGGFGVKINDSPIGSLFAFNTVARNASDGSGPPAVVCNAAATLQSSIIALNVPAFNGSQVTKPGCTLMNVVTGPDNATGANMAPPAFKSTTDFHLDISNAANDQLNKTCCIDQLTAPGTANSDHDVDFTKRPKGTGPKNYDIGAHEAE